MKKQPIPKDLPQCGWSATKQKNLKDSLLSLYKKIENKEETSLERSPQEASYMRNLLEQNPDLTKEVENLPTLEVLKQKLSLWIEEPATNQAANTLGDAAKEVEAQFLLQKDLIQVEILRRKAKEDTQQK